jgi:predicted dehydrogenase
VRERVTAVVVGAGLMGRWHAHAIRRSGALVAGVVDSDPARAAHLVARHPRARAFGHLGAALEVLAPRAVHICTPLDSHVALVRTALKAGCHVLAEKPLAPTAGLTRDLLAFASSVGCLLVPVHQFPWQQGSLALVQRLPVLGPIVHLEIGAASAGASGAGEESADTIAADILPHFLALARLLLDVPLAEQHWTVDKPRLGEWRVAGRCGTISVHFFVSMAARPTFAELRLFGQRGSARLDLFHGFAVFEGGVVSRSSKITRPFRTAAQSLVAASSNLLGRAVCREPAYPGLMHLVRQFYLAVEGRARSPIRPEETLDIARTRDVLMALSAAGSSSDAESLLVGRELVPSVLPDRAV